MMYFFFRELSAAQLQEIRGLVLGLLIGFAVIYLLGVLLNIIATVIDWWRAR